MFHQKGGIEERVCEVMFDYNQSRKLRPDFMQAHPFWPSSFVTATRAASVFPKNIKSVAIF